MRVPTDIIIKVWREQARRVKNVGAVARYRDELPAPVAWLLGEITQSPQPSRRSQSIFLENALKIAAISWELAPYLRKRCRSICSPGC